MPSVRRACSEHHEVSRTRQRPRGVAVAHHRVRAASDRQNNIHAYRDFESRVLEQPEFVSSRAHSMDDRCRKLLASSNASAVWKSDDAIKVATVLSHAPPLIRLFLSTQPDDFKFETFGALERALTGFISRQMTYDEQGMWKIDEVGHVH